MNLDVMRVGSHELPLPRYETEGASGLDLRAAIARAVWLWPLQRKAIPCGFAMRADTMRTARPEEMVDLEVRPRSGISLKRGLLAIQGTIDPDYTGLVQVVLVNLSWWPKRVAPGERIAQAVPHRRPRVEVKPVTSLGTTARGANGFGSTGEG